MQKFLQYTYYFETISHIFKSEGILDCMLDNYRDSNVS